MYRFDVVQKNNFKIGFSDLLNGMECLIVIGGRMKYICLIATPYALLQILLLKNIDDCIFFFDECFPKDIIRNIKRRKRPCFKARNSFLGLLINRVYLLYYVFVNDVSKICCIGQDHVFMSNLLWEKFFLDIPFDVVEDGTANYERCLEDIVASSKPYNHIILGVEHRVRKIYLTGENKIIPNFYNGRIELINLSVLWSSSRDKQYDVIKIFGLDKIYSTVAKKKYFLLTQNFSDAGMMSELEQKNLYKKILSHYDFDDVIIKPHPLDNTKYDKLFKNIPIFPRYVPFELIYLLYGESIRLMKCITVSSSAIFLIDEKNVERYDMDGNFVNGIDLNKSGECFE